MNKVSGNYGLSKVTPANKIHTQSCKRIASKVKVHSPNLNNFNIALVFAFISYKVTPFLVFAVAKI